MKRLALLFTLFTFGLGAQSLPDGEGRRLVQDICGSCHDLVIVTSVEATESGWRAIVQRMLELGAVASDSEVETMVTYLAEAFPGKEVKAKQGQPASH